MQYFLAVVLSVLSLSTASVLPRARCVPSSENACPATADFDDLPAGLITAPYTHLQWYNFTVTPRSNRLLKPHTSPNYAISGPFPDLYAGPGFRIQGSTTTFTLDSFHAGCLDPTTKKAVTCQFVIECLTADRHEGPILENYTPVVGKGGKAALQEYTPGFRYCVDARTFVYSSDIGFEKTQIIFDTVKIGYRQ